MRGWLHPGRLAGAHHDCSRWRRRAIRLSPHEIDADDRGRGRAVGGRIAGSAYLARSRTVTSVPRGSVRLSRLRRVRCDDSKVRRQIRVGRRWNVSPHISRRDRVSHAPGIRCNNSPSATGSAPTRRSRIRRSPGAAASAPSRPARRSRIRRGARVHHDAPRRPTRRNLASSTRHRPSRAPRRSTGPRTTAASIRSNRRNPTTVSACGGRIRMAILPAAILLSRPMRREVHTGREKEGCRACGQNGRVRASQVHDLREYVAHYYGVPRLQVQPSRGCRLSGARHGNGGRRGAARAIVRSTFGSL